MPSTNPKQTNNNKNYPLLSLDGWYEHGQLLLENTYLQPFKQTSNGFSKTIRIKENPRNGYIEREIHGAMHASRVAWSSMMLHKLCQQHYAVAAESKFNSLLKYLDLKEDDVLCLIRYVALGHDAAREGDGYDRWEAESAEKIQHFFESHSIETEKAIILSKLASLKDKPKELTEFLQEQKLSSEAIEGLQYARVLISLSDCFDIIRCNRLFDFKYITQKLSEVFDYEPEKDGSVFFEYAKNLLEIIKKQQDLYFPTELIGFNKETYRLDEGEADYSPKAKVGLEHASNAIMAMQISLQQHPYFAKLLPFESPIEEIESEVKPAFNPYIHGTNSSALALMTETGFQLMSPLEMLERYQRAPLSGELTKGGLSSAKSDGKPCFARLNGEINSNEYSLEIIISNYASVSSTITPQKCKSILTDYCSYASRELFSTINIINIYLARAKQLGSVDISPTAYVPRLDRGIQ